MRKLEMYFNSRVEIPLVNFEKRQRIETLIKEESRLLVQYFGGETQNWTPRIPMVIEICDFFQSSFYLIDRSPMITTRERARVQP